MQQLTIFDEQEEYQPRFQAYLDYVGATHKDEVVMREFMQWISKHIRIFKKSKNMYRYQPMTEKHHDEFTKYLQELEPK